MSKTYQNDLVAKADPAQLSSSGKSTKGGCSKIFLYSAAALIALSIFSPNTFSHSSTEEAPGTTTPNNAELASLVMHGDARVATGNKSLNLVVGQDITAGTYLFYPIDGWDASGWASVRSARNEGLGGGYVSGWTTLPVRDSQILQVSHVHFCLIDDCDLSAIDGQINERTVKDGTTTKPSSTSYGSGRYDAVCGAAESIKEQYPGISWSSQWEELSNMGYSNDEIAWAIGG